MSWLDENAAPDVPENAEKALYYATMELISGLSALNMEPDPKTEEELAALKATSDVVYISQSDRWVEHAVDHFRKVLEHIRAAQRMMPDTAWLEMEEKIRKSKEA